MRNIFKKMLIILVISVFIVSNLFPMVYAEGSSVQSETQTELTEQETTEKESVSAESSENKEAEKTDIDGHGDNVSPDQNSENKANEDFEEKDNMKAFSEEVRIDDAVISVSAEESVIPDGSSLSVEKVEKKADIKAAQDAVDAEKEDKKINNNVAKSFTYDIRILDAEKNEIQPEDEVNVSFKSDLVENKNLDTTVYHINEETVENKKTGEEETVYTASALKESKEETEDDEYKVVSDGFSYYTVEFTYNDLQYVMEGNSEVSIYDILEALNLSGTVSDVAFSDNRLLEATEKGDDWIIKSKKAFTSNEWMKITIGGIEYTIELTDALTGNAYAVLDNSGNLIFFRSTSSYTNDTTGTFTDIAGNSYAGRIFSGIETINESREANCKWYNYKESIKTASVASDQTISPINMGFWFYVHTSMTSCDLTGFDTSDVTSMEATFASCPNLISVDLSGLDTSSVIKTNSMFEDCRNLLHLDGLSEWNTSGLEDAAWMFYGCSSLTNIDVSEWDTNNLSNIGGIFRYCSSLTSLDLSKWNTGNLTDTSNAFMDCTNLESLNLSGWNTSNVSNMGHIFANCSSLIELDVSDFDTINVQYLDNMFNGCSSLTSLDLSNFDTSSATNMGDMFNGCDSLDTVTLGTNFAFTVDGITDDSLKAILPPGRWKKDGSNSIYTETKLRDSYNGATMAGTYRKQNAYAVLDNSGNLIFFRSNSSYTNDTTGTFTDIDGNEYTGTIFSEVETTNANDTTNSKWYSSRASVKTISTALGQKITPVNMSYWFNGCTTLTNADLSGFDLSEVTSMNRTFNGCTALTTVNLGESANTNLVNTSRCFYNDSKLTTIYASENWTRTQITSGSNMFYNCTKLKGGNGTSFNSSYITATRAQIDKSGQTGYFTLLQAIAEFDSSTGTLRIFKGGGYINGQVVGTKTYWTGIEDLTGETAPKWESIRESITNVVIEDKYKPKTAFWLFAHMNITSITGLSNLDTSDVTNMHAMFNCCYNLGNIDISGWDTSNVTKMSFMFEFCNNLESVGDLSDWDTSNVTSMRAMFKDCSNLTDIDVSKWNVGNVTDMGWVFEGCSNLTDLDVSKWDVGNATDISAMFMACSNLTDLDVSGWNTGNVTVITNIFRNCSSLTNLDISNFDTHNCTGFGHFMADCSSLETVNMSGLDFSSAEYMDSFLEGCTNLESVDLSNVNTSGVKYMQNMFKNCSSLESLDLSSFDTRSVTYNNDSEWNLGAQDMFDGCTSLESITLGENFRFTGDGITDPTYQAILPTPNSTTGKWIKEDKSIAAKTPEELRDDYDANASSWKGTWVWDTVVTITYDANGGSNAPAAQEKEPDVDLILTTDVPTRNGYNFYKWNTKADGSGTYYEKGAAYSVDEDVILYAQWELAMPVPTGIKNNSYILIIVVLTTGIAAILYTKALKKTE